MLMTKGISFCNLHKLIYYKDICPMNVNHLYQYSRKLSNTANR